MDRYLINGSAQRKKKVGTVGYTDAIALALLYLYTIREGDAAAEGMMKKCLGAMSTGYLDNTVQGTETLMEMEEDLDHRENRAQFGAPFPSSRDQKLYSHVAMPQNQPTKRKSGEND